MGKLHLTTTKHVYNIKMSKATTPVLYALQSLLFIKDTVTYAEIASVTGIKKQLALEIIIRNKHLLRMSKDGKITGIISDEQNARRLAHAEFTCGKVFKIEAANYGLINIIVVDAHYKDKVTHLFESYCVGGLGDNFFTKYIIDTCNNRQALNELGFTQEYTARIAELLKESASRSELSWCESP